MIRRQNDKSTPEAFLRLIKNVLWRRLHHLQKSITCISITCLYTIVTTHYTNLFSRYHAQKQLHILHYRNAVILVNDQFLFTRTNTCDKCFSIARSFCLPLPYLQTWSHTPYANAIMTNIVRSSSSAGKIFALTIS